MSLPAAKPDARIRGGSSDLTFGQFLSDDEFEPIEENRSIGDGVQVKIIVGSSVFLTHVSTICARDPDSVLARIVSQKLQSESVPCLRFNRDALWFTLVMSYLRTGSVDIRRLTPNQLQSFIHETQFYGLQGLQDKVIAERERRISPTLSRTGPACAAEEEEAMKNRPEVKSIVEDELIFEMIM